MFFIYTLYDYVLGEKKITTTLKKDPTARNYTLQIITPARSFLGAPVGGGFVKLSRLYTEEGKLIHARHYSDELKAEVKAYKKNFSIPYFHIWKGFIYFTLAALIGGIIYAGKLKYDRLQSANSTAALVDKLQQLQPGQQYGVSLYTNLEGENQSLQEAWIKINKIEADTVFIQRSKQTREVTGLFDMTKLAPIKPNNEQEWETTIERVNYPRLKEQLEEKDKSSFDLQYIGDDLNRYRGIVFSIKGND